MCGDNLPAVWWQNSMQGCMKGVEIAGGAHMSARHHYSVNVVPRAHVIRTRHTNYRYSLRSQQPACKYSYAHELVFTPNNFAAVKF